MKVRPAATAPTTSWRSPLYHQLRAVTRETSAPAPNRARQETTAEVTQAGDPQQVRQQRQERAHAEEQERGERGGPRRGQVARGSTPSSALGVCLQSLHRIQRDLPGHLGRQRRRSTPRPS